METIIGNENGQEFIGKLNDNFSECAVGVNPALFSKTRKLKVLCIGNSFTCDSFRYLPFILKQSFGINIVLGILFEPNATIQTAIDHYTTTDTDYYHIIDTETDSVWTSTAAVKIQDKVKERAWDIIVLQMGSAASYSYTSYDTEVGSLIAMLDADVIAPMRLAWNINHLGKSHFTGSKDKTYWTRVLNCCEKAVSEYGIPFVFPYGTAMFNAMEKYVNIGDQNYFAVDAAGHLQEGMPCYLAAIANVQAILDEYYPGLTVLEDDFVPTSPAVFPSTSWSHGTLISMTDQQRLDCQIAAIQANRNKFTINQIT